MQFDPNLPQHAIPLPLLLLLLLLVKIAVEYGFVTTASSSSFTAGPGSQVCRAPYDFHALNHNT